MPKHLLSDKTIHGTKIAVNWVGRRLKEHIAWKRQLFVQPPRANMFRQSEAFSGKTDTAQR